MQDARAVCCYQRESDVIYNMYSFTSSNPRTHDEVSNILVIVGCTAEGYEYEVLSTWRPEDNLPQELSMEFHAAPHLHNRGVWPSSVGELGLSFMHLANLGYAAYSKEVNPLAPDCCAEFSFLRLHTDATSSVKPS